MYPICVCAIELNKAGACFLRKTGETERREVPRALARFLYHLDGKTDPLTLAPLFTAEQMDWLLSMLKEMERRKVPRSLALYLAQLDGKTDPHTPAPQCTAEQMDELLSMLKKMGYITDTRRSGVFFAAQNTLWFAPRRIPAAVRRVCRVISMTLLFIWLPVLIVGMIQLLRVNWTDGGSSTLGVVLGLLAGIVFHEAGHAVSCVGLGGRLVRAGVCSQLIVIPGAFVEVDYIRLPRAARIHTLLSGVEANFLLAGLAFLASVIVWGDCFAMFGLMNLMLGFLNSGVYFIALDGGRALEELIGADLNLSEKILEEHRARRTIRRRAGITGSARIAATHVLCVLQLGILSLVILNLKEVISWIF